MVNALSRYIVMLEWRVCLSGDVVMCRSNVGRCRCPTVGVLERYHCWRRVLVLDEAQKEADEDVPERAVAPLQALAAPLSLPNVVCGLSSGVQLEGVECVRPESA